MSEATTTTDDLRRQHAHLRKIYCRVWLGMALFILIAGAVGWLLTGSADSLSGGALYAVPAIIGWILTRFFWLNPKRDPVATQERLVQLDIRTQKAARTSSRINGYMFIVSSPIMLVLMVGGGAAEYGVWGGLLGLLVAGLWLAGGVWGVHWAKRH